MDRLTSMSVFVKVADLGSFAAAAKELRLSPTMIGKHMRYLEERLGSRLINRTTRRQTTSIIVVVCWRKPKPETRWLKKP
jgi:DNA-binding transcriptional LysR family regulator